MTFFKRLQLPVYFGVILTLSPAHGFAWSGKVEALGQPTLVLEDETTAVSLFTLGNPAGLALLPPRNRLDTQIDFFQARRESQFIAGDAGTAGVVSPAGTTLPAGQTLSSKTSRTLASINSNLAPGYGGYITWLNENWAVQMIPLGAYASNAGDGRFAGQENYSAGGQVRASGRITDSFSLGLGISAQAAHLAGWDGKWVVNPGTTTLTASKAEGAWDPANPDLDQFRLWQADPFGATLTAFRSHADWDGLNTLAEAGAAYRWKGFVDEADQLDLGLRLQAGSSQVQSTHHLFSDPMSENELPFLGTAHSRYQPLDIQAQGVYNYKSQLTASLIAGYEGFSRYRSWEAGALGAQDEFLSARLKNLTYELGLRLRLPMIREDDLRFGVVFNNRGWGHPYPTGEMQTADPATLALGNIITTVSSGIGIGCAFIPAEGSLVSLEYRLGSSKTRQSGSILEDSGINQFSLGAQYQVLSWLYARAGFITRHLAFQAADEVDLSNIQSRVIETNSLRFGVGIEQAPFRLDATLILQRVLHSPVGWDLEEKPLAEVAVPRDDESGLSGVIGFTWMF